MNKKGDSKKCTPFFLQSKGTVIVAEFELGGSTIISQPTLCAYHKRDNRFAGSAASIPAPPPPLIILSDSPVCCTLKTTGLSLCGIPPTFAGPPPGLSQALGEVEVKGEEEESPGMAKLTGTHHW